MTENGKQNQLAMLGVERKKRTRNSKLTRKMSTIDSILYSVRNSATVQELNQVDDLFKLDEGINERMKAVNDEVNEDDKWFEQLDDEVFSFKHTIHSWLKDFELKRMVNHVPSREGSKKNSEAK